MKRYIGYFQTSVSAISSKEEVHKWAAKMLADRPQLQKVHICEVIETAERTTPTIEVKSFFVATEASEDHTLDAAKAA